MVTNGDKVADIQNFPQNGDKQHDINSHTRGVCGNFATVTFLQQCDIFAPGEQNVNETRCDKYATPVAKLQHWNKT